MKLTQIIPMLCGMAAMSAFSAVAQTPAPEQAPAPSAPSADCKCVDCKCVDCKCTPKPACKDCSCMECKCVEKKGPKAGCADKQSPEKKGCCSHDGPKGPKKPHHGPKHGKPAPAPEAPAPAPEAPAPEAPAVQLPPVAPQA